MLGGSKCLEYLSSLLMLRDKGLVYSTRTVAVGKSTNMVEPGETI